MTSTAIVRQELAVAALKKVYDVGAVETALGELNDNSNDALRATYEKMLRVGGLRFCVKPNRMPAFDQIAGELPNFGEPLEDVRRQIALCSGTDDRLEFVPMLLLGEPGIGKTHFAKHLARLLGTTCHYVAMSSLTAGWILSGASSQWKNAKPGKVFEALVQGSYANPVILIDEIDKASGDANYDPLGALYALLEHDTASSFIDEFAEVPIDAASVIWIATANDARGIPEPILNRMNVYEIPAPDRDGARRIAQTLYTEIRGAHAWGAHFPEQLEAEPLERLAAMKPREIRRAVLHAFGNARLAGRDSVSTGDVESGRLARRRAIGF
ncbi:MAG: AAA family ATPase [Pararobbsia sp.]